MLKLYDYTFLKILRFVKTYVRPPAHKEDSLAVGILALTEFMNVMTLHEKLYPAKVHPYYFLMWVVFIIGGNFWYFSSDRAFDIYADKRWDSFENGFRKHIGSAVVLGYVVLSVVTFWECFGDLYFA